MFKGLNHLENVCRFCLLEVLENPISILDREKNSELKYGDIAADLMNIHVKEDDNLTKILCDACASNLLFFHRFQQQCKSSENVLNELVLGQSKYVAEDSQFPVATLTANKKDEATSPAGLSELEVNSPISLKSKCEEHSQIQYDDDISLGLPSSQNSSSGTSVKKFECEVCSQRFTRKSHVTIHMRRHTNQNPYGCDVCPAAFRKSSDLGRHRKIHSDRKDYICEVCGRMFKRSSDVKSHMNSHTGRKPYKCRKCPREYSAYSSMMKHCRKFSHL